MKPSVIPMLFLSCALATISKGDQDRANHPKAGGADSSDARTKQPPSPINCGHYGWLGDFHDSGGAYPAYYDRAYFRRHHINWFWLGDQWVVPYLLSDSNQVREGIHEFKRSCKIWYEAFWWGDHSRWSNPGERQAFGAGSIPQAVLDKLKTKGIQPGGDNLAGKTWLDIAANPALLASVKKTIAWQLDTIFEHCGKDALYGVVLSEEEPDVCLSFGGYGAEAYEQFRRDKTAVQEKMTVVLNKIYDFIKDRYPWLKVAPGVYWHWVRPDLKRDAVVMDLYPNPGDEETAIKNWIAAWGANTEHYVILWGYGNLDRKLECDRFDKVTRGFMQRGFKNLGFFHPKLALEDRVYRLFNAHGASLHPSYDLTKHAGHARDLITETSAIISKLAPLIGQRLPKRPDYPDTSEAYQSRKGLIEIADAWYEFRERLLDDAYACVRKLNGYGKLSSVINIMQAEGFFPDAYAQNDRLAPAEFVKLETLSKEWQTLPEFYSQFIPLEKRLLADAKDVAKNIAIQPGAEFTPALRAKLPQHLDKIVATLKNADCLSAYENAQELYEILRTAGADRSWRLRIVFGNSYGYPLNMRVDLSVDYGKGEPVTIRSDTPFEKSAAPSEEWMVYLPKQPAVVRINTVPWSGNLHVRTLEISQSRRTLIPKSHSNADHVTGLAEWLADENAGFLLAPWSSTAGVTIKY